jgi:tol-pal system protein YbgF
LIKIYDSRDEQIGIGSGFFIDEEGILVTNHHVIEEGAKAIAQLSTGEFVPIEGILAEDKDGDLVLLTIGVKERSFPTLKLTKRGVKAGQPVVVIGSPFGLVGTVSDGIISAVRDTPKLGKFIQITAPVSKGSSGSPVINMNGEVIGIATLSFIGGQSLNFATSADKIIDLLSRAPGDLYENAYEDFHRGNFEEARTKFLRFLKYYSNKELSEDALFLVGETYFFEKDYENAISEYKKVVAEYPKGNKVPAALFKQAIAFLKLKDKNNAVNLLKRLISKYPNSDQAEMAKKSLDEMEKEIARPGIEGGRASLSLIPPQGSPPEPLPNIESKLSEYYSMVWAKVKEEWTIPENLLGEKEMVNLETVIVIIIERNGKIQKTWFEKKSGNAVYDQSVMRALMKAEPFPPIPKEFDENTLEIGIRFFPD